MSGVQRKALWRWPIYFVATLSCLVGLLWLLEAASGMGFGDRSPIRIITFLILIIFMPVILTYFLALRAVSKAQVGELGPAVALVCASLLTLPVFWILEAFVLKI